MLGEPDRAVIPSAMTGPIRGGDRGVMSLEVDERGAIRRRAMEGDDTEPDRLDTARGEVSRPRGIHPRELGSRW